MRTSAVTAPLGQVKDVASLVLEAERAALAEVEQYQQEMHELVAASTLRAKQLQQRSEERIKRLRQRMTVTVQDRLAQIGGDMAALASDMGADEAILAYLDNAIDRVAEEIAGNFESG